MILVQRQFYILDVFAEKKYAGNQLAVIRDGAGLSSAEMLAITREMNYSESTFLLSEEKRNGGYDVRIFTPGEEIPFAGHPTLGTAWLIQQEIIQQPVPRVVLNYQVGQIPVDFIYKNGQPEELWMQQLEPQFGTTFPAAAVAEVLGLSADQIDQRFPCQEVSTGLPFVIVPLKSLAAVRACRPHTSALLELLANSEAKNMLVFAPETYRQENHLNVRVFTDYLGIPEDPATGSANGCLAGYLAKHRYFGSPQVNVRVEQGYEINRESLLLLRAGDTGQKISIQVGGRVVLVAKGELL
ncbi:MAG TPA: PhzF family phenazine biosynthesis protein [Firmicutes bacterium]|jgi:trans-2,3-dihydro-3-hydroxyanthranilate isomerase|nr:PhzF family phenazine biosynthesis protein [Bacillota bacterium]